MNGMNKKESKRSLLLQRRKMESAESIKDKSILIQNHLFSLDEYQKARTIMYYVSFDNEVNTHEMIIASLSTNKTILVPLTDKQNLTITPSVIHAWEDLTPGDYGILAPSHEQALPVSIIDLIIIPGVGFDRTGNRIGHGKGYYDRLLSKTTHAIRVGLAFEFQVMDSIPTDTHDIIMDLIITEQQIIRCQN